MKIYKSLTLMILMSFFVTYGFSQNGCIDECLDECYTIQNGCINGAYSSWSKCKKKCAIDYPHWADNGYYGDYCYLNCDYSLESAVASCIFSADNCIDQCDALLEDCTCDHCIDGFTYNEQTGQCEFIVQEGYTIVTIDGKIYVSKNCDMPQNECCPEGFQTAWDELCSITYFSEECQNTINEIQTQAALDAAQGDPIDWDDINRQIEDIQNDLDCYITEREDECEYCISEILDVITISQSVNIEGNVITIGSYCQ